MTPCDAAREPALTKLLTIVRACRPRARQAVRTATFVGRKLGFDQPGAAEYTGEVVVVPIGCPPEAWAHVTA